MPGAFVSMRFTNRMSAKWTWFFGLVGIAGLVLTIYLYFAAQTVTARDWFVFGLGLIVGAMVAAFSASFIFHSRRSESSRDHDKATTTTKAQAISLMPTRAERLREIQAEIAQVRIDIAKAQGTVKSLQYSAEEAASHGFRDIAQDHLTNGQTWIIQSEHLAQVFADLLEQMKSLEEQSDEEYLAEQKHLRGLD